MRCRMRLNVQETDIYCRILMIDFRKESTYLLRSFMKIESLSED